MRGYLPEHRVEVPRDLDDALARMAAAPGRWQALAGGTDLMVTLAAGQLAPGSFLSIRHLSELRGVRVETDEVRIGALTRYSDIVAHDGLAAEFPMLKTAASQSGAVAIQNRGTIGGNVVNASPAADTPPALLAYDAEVELASVRGRRRLAYADFHTGYKTTLRAPDELLSAVILPRTRATTLDVYRKVGTRKAQAIAKVGVAARFVLDGLRVHDVRIGLSSVAPMPWLASRTAAMLRGGRLDDASLRAQAVGALGAEVRPIDDVRSTAAYRRQVAQRLLADMLVGLAAGGRPVAAP